MNTDSIHCPFPLNYCLRLPSLHFHQWDADYNFYDKYLTPSIVRTQTGLGFVKDGVHVWLCVPSARTHVQLDTATSIKDAAAIIGEWEVVCSRAIKFVDSVVYATHTIYRSAQLVAEGEEQEGKLTLTEDLFRLYEKKHGRDNYKKVVGKRYKLINGRILLLYSLIKSRAAVSFLGLDTAGNLILNNHSVEERKQPGVYIAYQSVMSQFIFKRK